jgi:hypothetical protein
MNEDMQMEHITQKVRRLMDQFSRLCIGAHFGEQTRDVYNHLGLALNELLRYVQATEGSYRDMSDQLDKSKADIRLLKISLTRLRRQWENSEIEIVSLINELDKMANAANESMLENQQLIQNQRRRNDEWTKQLDASIETIAKLNAAIDNKDARISELQTIIAKLETHIQAQIAKHGKTTEAPQNHRHPQEPIWEAEAEVKAALHADRLQATPMHQPVEDGPAYHPLQEPAWEQKLHNGNHRVSRAEYNGRACVEEYRDGSWYLVVNSPNSGPQLFFSTEDAQAYCDQKNAALLQPAVRSSATDAPGVTGSEDDNGDDGLTV